MSATHNYSMQFYIDFNIVYLLHHFVSTAIVSYLSIIIEYLVQLKHWHKEPYEYSCLLLAFFVTVGIL